MDLIIRPISLLSSKGFFEKEQPWFVQVLSFEHGAYSDDTIHIKQLYAVTKKYPTNRLTILFLDLLQVLKKSTTTPCLAIGMAPSLLNRTLK